VWCVWGVCVCVGSGVGVGGGLCGGGVYVVVVVCVVVCVVVVVCAWGCVSVANRSVHSDPYNVPCRMMENLDCAAKAEGIKPVLSHACSISALSTLFWIFVNNSVATLFIHTYRYRHRYIHIYIHRYIDLYIDRYRDRKIQR